MAAEVLARAGVRVVVFEQKQSLGRKFLLAGRGGLNLTHSEDLDTFLSRYRNAPAQLTAAIRAFDPAALRAWADGLGAATFVGSSGRVFPGSFRATPLLRAWLTRLRELGVEFRVRSRWNGWAENGSLLVTERDGPTSEFEANAVVLTTGGASWPRTGSDGAWVDPLVATNVEVAPLRPSNMGFAVTWSDEFRTRFAGTPMKDLALRFGGETSRGDLMVTNAGIEGGVVYALSSPLRDEIDGCGHATLAVDLRPNESTDALADRLTRRRQKESIASWLEGAGLASSAVSLLREVTGNRVPTEAAALARLAKSLPLRLDGVQSIERAISTSGGVRFSEVDDRFMLRRRPGTFVAGEMLDWDAPTGGYLLQACFSTGGAAARGALGWLG